MRKKKSKYMNLGIRWFFLITVILFVLLVGRVSYVQLADKVEGTEIKNYVNEKYNSTQVIPALRGGIYDANGQPLAEEVNSYTVSAVLDPKASKNSKIPLNVVDKEKTARELAPILNVSEQSILDQLSKKKYQVELGPGGRRNISQDKKDKIEKLALPGIIFTPTHTRYYPNGVFASHILGYTTLDDAGNLVGEMGLEKSLNKEMTEKDGKVTYLRDRKGNILPYAKEKITPPKNGDNVNLTLETKIQSLLEDSMTEVEKEYKPEKMVAIVEDPKTGKILAMSNRPSFDPNKHDITNYTNDAVSSAFESGSTMKIFTVAAAMNEGVYNGNEYYHSGSYKIGKTTIHDVNRSGWGSITFDEGVQRSSNVAMAILLNQKLGADRYLQYYKKFGLTQKTGINIPGEVAGRLLYNMPLEQTTTAFGQGSTVTPIEIVQGAGAIANDGKMMKPYLVNSIVDPDTQKTVTQYHPEVVDTPITAETAKRERALLSTVITSPHGTGHAYALDGYTLAGKTGTAQISDGKGQYSKGLGQNYFSFIGMAPADKPELVMYVSVLKPKLQPTQLGSAPVSQIFKTVMQGALEYMKVEKTGTENVKQIVDHDSTSVPNLQGLSVDDAKSLTIGNGLKFVQLGDGSTVLGQSIKNGSKVVRGTTIYVKTDGKNKMPLMDGWSLLDVRRISDLFNLKLTTKGSGFVISQSKNSGSEIRDGDFLSIELQPPSQAENSQNKIEVKTKG
ncbi:PASTA domain-containing protein [Bacillus sp. RG28]|uniref:serine-type D-Ala-D-Ala carboxypeptidase n=1 Tax=Gottfriedia endophytica TaxID=2820819 RepID=A0A940NG38_9BACI|nr:PASTA domain-containing penicillin-binding protein [Gottfriedia endophytica]MBP0724809.1 PASTA domain-containing protein [Gottfriedia endophytica]